PASYSGTSASRSKEISSSAESRHRLPRSGCEEGGRVMATPTIKPSSAVPALSAERPVNWPTRVKSKLANGLEIVLVEAHSIPRFHGNLCFRSGNAAVSNVSPGLADMTATMVRTGTTKRVSREIEEDLRRLGADLSTSAGQDTSAIAFAGLSEF